MFRIDQHIELLLLQHDCVVIPGFGGFVAHHQPAKVGDEGRIMLPPTRTVGFNPQLKVNDSLLIQSYVEAYDLSYPEAQRVLEAEVEELKGTLADNGSFVFSSIGTLSCESGDRLAFQPLESGLLSPNLYGLSDINISTGNSFATKNAKVVSIFENTSIEDVKDTDYEDDNVIKIKTSTLKYIAAVCVAILLLAIYPILNYTGGNEILSSVFGNFSFKSENKLVAPKKPTYHVYIYNKVKKAENAEKENTIKEADEVAPYTIVLAARISKKNAENYVYELQKMGLEDVRITGKGKSRKVVCGNYATENEARSARNSKFSKDFPDAWILKEFRN